MNYQELGKVKSHPRVLQYYFYNPVQNVHGLFSVIVKLLYYYPVCPVLKGEGEGGIWTRESVWGTQGRKTPHMLLYAQTSPFPSPFKPRPCRLLNYF